jgi:TonB family protein
MNSEPFDKLRAGSEQKISNSRRSWALGSSLLLHGLVLISLMFGMMPGPAPEPGALVVSLAMPSIEARLVSAGEVPAAMTASAKPAILQPDKMMQPGPVKVDSASIAQKIEPIVPPEPEMDLLKDQITEISEQPAGELSKIDTFTSAISSEPLATLPDHQSNPSDGSIDLAGEIYGNLSDHRSPITDYRLPLLAFAGDPAALGMIAMEALGPGLVEAEVLTLPEPVYPVLSRKRGEEGRVVVQTEISAKGKVLKAQVTESSSFPRLDRAALEAVKMAAFNPATEYGVPVESERTVAYRFELE